MYEIKIEYNIFLVFQWWKAHKMLMRLGLILITLFDKSVQATLESDCALWPDSLYVESSCVIVNQVHLFGSISPKKRYFKTSTFSPSVAFYDSCTHLPSYHAHPYWPQSFAIHDAIANLPLYKWVGMQRLNLTDTTGLSEWFFIDGDGQKYGPLPPMGRNK